MERTKEDARLDEIAGLLAHLAPGGWELVELTYRAAGASFEQIFVSGGLIDPREAHRHNEASVFWMRAMTMAIPHSGIYPLLRELRSGMHREGEGTWLELDLQVHCRSDRTSLTEGDTPLWGVSYENADEIAWAGEITPAAAAEELRMFPREPQRIPPWLADLAAVQHPADRFDAQAFLTSPQSEDDLITSLPDGLETLFSTAREHLTDILPGSADLFLTGRLADGCWSVLHAAPSWLAVRMENGACVEKRAFADPAAAVAFAAGAVLAEAGAEVNSWLLHAAEAISKVEAPSKNIDVWRRPDYDKKGAKQVNRTLAAERPHGAAARGRRYLQLAPLDNSPGDYFVAQPGPPPAKGDFVSTHQIFEWYLEDLLPRAKGPAQEPAEYTSSEVVLEVGMELDALDGPDRPFLFTIGTPFERRGLWGTAEEYSHHYYRVQRPIPVSSGLFSATPIFSDGNTAAPSQDEDQGRGFYLHRPISDLLRSGELVEITGPGGDPLPSGDDTDRKE